jgi:transcriptional regulator with XRE-family HTH domain
MNYFCVRKLARMSSQPDSSRVPEWTIAERLYLARTVAGYEKQQLADVIGVSRDTIGSYESRGWVRRRSPAYIKAWALACNVDATWLQTGHTDPNGGPVVFGMDFRSGSLGRSARITPFVLAA